MNNEELYVTVESGGTIAENARGHYRVMGGPKSKEEAKEHTRWMTKTFGGGYYGYKYRTVTLAWAIKNANYVCKEGT